MAQSLFTSSAGRTESGEREGFSLGGYVVHPSPLSPSGTQLGISNYLDLNVNKLRERKSLLCHETSAPFNRDAAASGRESSPPAPRGPGTPG